VSKSKKADGPDPTFLAIKAMLERTKGPPGYKTVRYEEPGRYEVRTDVHASGDRESMIPFAILEAKSGVKLKLFARLTYKNVRAAVTPALKAVSLIDGKSFSFKTPPDAKTLADLAALIELADELWYQAVGDA
jgi:hypothetical protein